MENMWRHQEEDLEASWEMPAAALYWEPRLGKSRVAIHTAERLAGVDRIDSCVVVAPNGVHINWTRDQLPLYWNRPKSMVVEWRSGRAGTKSFIKELADALLYDGFVWFACNVEAVATPLLNRFLTRLVRKRRCMLVVDESQYIKNWKAKRTRALMRLAESCPYRRILTGTPTPQGPFDLWSQFYVLNPEVLGYRYTTFKQRYGVWRKRKFGNGPVFDQLVEYQNLDDLTRRIAPLTFERKKSECMDLPERLFVKRYFELPPEHLRIYRQLRDEFIAEIDSGAEIAAPQALVNLLRLQQISRGHVADRILDPPHPSVDATAEILRNHRGKAIVWCRFLRDVELVSGILQKEHGAGSTVVCIGSTPAGTRADLRERFRADPTTRFWVGTLGTGGIGVDLGAASLMIFYSHGYDLAQRLQGLERNYGDSQKSSRIEVIDVIAADTVDERILHILDRKESLSARLSTAKYRELLKE